MPQTNTYRIQSLKAELDNIYKMFKLMMQLHEIINLIGHGDVGYLLQMMQRSLRYGSVACFKTTYK